MESVLKQLESRIEEFTKAYQDEHARAKELEERVGELESQVAEQNEAGERIEALEKQRDELAERLKKVLEHIDSVLVDSEE